MKETLYIMGNTVYTFEGEIGFFRWMRCRGIDNQRAYEHILHEREHLEMARSLGYEARYGIRSDHINRWVPITFFPDRENISLEEMIKISLAPVIPSYSDIGLAEICKEKIRKEKNDRKNF